MKTAFVPQLKTACFRDDDELLTQCLGESFASNPLPPPHSLLLRHRGRRIFLSDEKNRSKSRGVHVRMKMRMKTKAIELGKTDQIRRTRRGCPRYVPEEKKLKKKETKSKQDKARPDKSRQDKTRQD
jgi:hypothetical protein